MKKFPHDFHVVDGVWHPFVEDSITYSDGDEAERYLEKTFANISDLSSDSLALGLAIKDWPSQYHLSPQRANLLRPLEIPGTARVLELGCGCGAVTRFLGENAGHVVAVEGSPGRARLARMRCGDLPNVDIVAGNFDDIRMTDPFEIVTLIGVLEYAGVFWRQAGDPFEGMLRFAWENLSPNGVLIIAIENKLGMKYFSGCTEDHLSRCFPGIEGYPDNNGPRTFGRAELIEIASRCGFAGFELLLPFPDYKIPSTIINGRFTSAEDCRKYNLVDWCRETFRDYGKEREHLFSDQLALSSAAQSGLMADFSNSFLLIAAKEPFGEDSVIRRPDWIAKRINMLRRPEYRTVTTLLEKDGTPVIAKERVNGLRQAPSFPVCLSVVAERAFIEGGKSLYQEMLRAIRRNAGGKKEFHDFVARWVDYLRSRRIPGTNLLPPDYLDCQPGNLILDSTGALHYIDDEWHWHEPVPMDWVLFRGLKVVWEECGQWIKRSLLRKDADFEDFLSLSLVPSGIPIGGKRTEELFALEKVFQGAVSGITVLGHPIDRQAPYLGGADEIAGNHLVSPPLAAPDPRMRVAVYSLDERGHACAHIRLFAPLHRLKQEVEYHWGVAKKGNNFHFLPEPSSKADLVVFQRFFPCEATWPFIDSVLRSGIPVVYELDDLLFDVPRTNPNRAYAARCAPYIEKLMRSCAAVTVSTSVLAEEVLPYNPLVHVLPNLLDEEVWLEERGGERDPWKLNGPGRPDCLVIGYTGTPTHYADLEQVEKALEIIADRYKEKVGFLYMGCATDRMMRLPGVSTIGFQPTYREYAKVLRGARIDIAIAPLADNRFNRCKSNIKWLEYSACGIPGIFQDLPPYNSSITHGSTGLLAGDRTQDWVDALDRLIRNPAERSAIADAARLEVGNRLTLSAQGRLYLDAYREIIERHARDARDRGERRIPAAVDGRGSGTEAAAPEAGGHSTPGGKADFVVSIVIPLFNKAEYTRKCLEALAGTIDTAGKVEVVLVDNASTDGTADFLHALTGDIVTVRNTTNFGFAAACNQGARVARGRNIVFLNNDTVPHPGWLEALLAAAEEEDAAICGARLLYPDGRIQHAGVAFNERGIGYHIFNGFPNDHPAVSRRRCFQAVTAACMLVRRDVFETLGGFDEGYRNGFEDVDFCLRAREKGHRVLYVPECIVVHHEETTEGRKAHDHENMERFLARWQGKIDPDDDRIYGEEGFRKIVSPDGTRITIEPVQGHRPDADDPASLGRSLKKEKRYAAAIEAFRQASSGGDLSVLADIGDCLAQEGKLEEAGAAYKEAIAANSSDPRALAGLGVLDLVKGNLAGAAERFTSVLETDDRDATALCGMGLARKAGGATGEAFEWFMKSLDADPVNVTALHELVKAAHESGRLEEAERCLSTYLQYKPADPHILFSLAGILFKSGKCDDALDTLDRLAFFDSSYGGANELRERIASPVQGAQCSLS